MNKKRMLKDIKKRKAKKHGTGEKKMIFIPPGSKVLDPKPNEIYITWRSRPKPQEGDETNGTSN